MDPPQPKDDVLWGFIAKAMWTGLLAYVVVLCIAFLRDILRKSRFFSRGSFHTLAYARFSPFTWHAMYLKIYRDTYVFYVIEFLRLAFNITVCVVYVIGTYRRNVITYIAVVQRVMAGFFIADLTSQMWAAESALSCTSTIPIFFDVFSLPSLIMASGPNAYLNFAFLRSIQSYVAFSRLERRLFVKVFSSKRLFAKLTLQCTTLFYALASGIQLLEVPGDLLSVEFRDTWFNYGDWNFFNSVYFVIVTLSTVGYGDFSPSTVQGRIFTVFMIIVGIVIFTSVIGELVEQSSRSRGSGWFVKNPDTRHVIVTGNPTLTDLVLFVSEFYSNSRESNSNAKIVVLIEEPTWTDPEWFQYIAKNSFLQARLQFLVGSVRNPLDLQRARLNSADAVFFLTSPSSGNDPSKQDTRTVMNILAVRNARTDIPVFAQTLLEESNLQTNVALRTPTSYTKGTYYRNTKAMRKGASYQGLFHAVLQAECHDLPKAHLKKGRECIEDILAHYNNTREEEYAVTNEGKEADLERSRLICLQATHMALISGNIKVNGVGTLLSNMYLDVQAEKPSPDDPSWLWEYHMGATCTLEYAIIPEMLNGVPVREIALELFHVGLVLVGTSDARHIRLNPLLDTDKFLRRGDIGVFLTYHHQDYVTAALYLVTARYYRGELRHPLLPSSSSGDDVSGTIVSLDAMNPKDSATGKPLGNGDVDIVHHARSEGKVQSRGVVREAAASSPALHVAFSGNSLQIGAGENEGDILGGNLLESQKSFLNEKCSDGYMPDALAGHVIVAMEGDAPLGNLPLFLKNLWRNDKRRSMRKARKARVVVIHPSISDQYREMFAHHERKSLFFIEGSPASGETWKRAKLKTAKSVATMADYTQPWNVSDARTIFMLLTLDVNTGNDHDVFICSELIDEKSLEFLREPTHPRRRGAMLGEASMRTVISSLNGNLSPVPVQSPTASNEVRVLRQGGTSRDASTGAQSRSVAFRDGEKESPEGSVKPTGTPGQTLGQPSQAEDVQVTLQDVTPEEATNLVNNPATAVRPGSNPTVSKIRSFKNSVMAVTSGGSQVSVRSGEPKEAKEPREARERRGTNPMTTMMEAHNNSGNNPGTGVDPADKPGAARARRGSLFSRSRYASGELLVHSSALTLLVREYVEPGFANFYTDLLGTVQPTPGLKIRLVRIPKSLFTAGRGVIFKKDRPLVPYNTVFKSLVRHGATPLGIYRSGNAPALIPTKNRHRRGPAILEQLEPYWKSFEEEDVSPGTTRKKTSFLGALFGLVRDVVPYNMREAQGREEINGGRRSRSSSDEDFDSDFESSDDDSAQEANGKGTGIKKNNANSGREEADAKKVAESRVSAEGKKSDVLKRISISSPRGGELIAKFLGNGEESFEVPGQTKYKERPVTDNLLPYVYTMPDPNTLCAETDGIYILCHPSLELSEKWTETVANNNDNESRES